MKTLTLSLLFGLFLAVHTNYCEAQTEDKNTILQIAQGDKLVLKKDLNIPANTERLNFEVKIDSGVRISGCAIVVTPSQKSRRIVSGGELLFSGESQAIQKKNQWGNLDYIYIARMMGSDAATALECYGNSFDANYKDLYVVGMKNVLKDIFDFIPADPEIVH